MLKRLPKSCTQTKFEPTQADSLAAHNLTLVAAHLCMAGAVDAGLLFSLLDFLTARCLICDRHRISVVIA